MEASSRIPPVTDTIPNNLDTPPESKLPSSPQQQQQSQKTTQQNQIIILPQPTITQSRPASSSTLAESSQLITKAPKAKIISSFRSNPILVVGSDRRSRKRKAKVTWQTDEKIQKVHYFEYDADERINVTRLNNNTVDQQNPDLSNLPSNVAGGFNLNANNKVPNAVGGGRILNASVDPIRRSNSKNDSDKCIEYLPWRSLIPIDFTPELQSPGWNSIERSAQAERETYVLGAIDLPGQPSTIDEPDQPTKTESNVTTTDSNLKDGAQSIIDIPADNVEGNFTVHSNMYLNDNGMPSDNPQSTVVPHIPPFCHPQSQLLPNPFQQQLVHATQNPFNFQDMGAQFQQQAQMQLQFPCHQNQQLSFQQPIMPFNQQQQIRLLPQQQQQPQNPSPFVDQQSGLTGPVMPWLSYPFNQVNENSHAHLFKRPAT